MESVVRSITDEGKIVTVWLDVPGKPVNTCTPQLLADLAQALDAIERDQPTGVIFASPKPRRIGLTRALPILLGGQTMPPRKALKAGLIDEVVRPEALLGAARRLVLTKPPRRKLKLLDRIVGSNSALRERVLASAEAQTR